MGSKGKRREGQGEKEEKGGEEKTPKQIPLYGLATATTATKLHYNKTKKLSTIKSCLSCT